MIIKVVFAITEIGADAAAGDYFTALELGQALHERFGWEIDYRSSTDSWYDLSGIDMLIVMVHEYELLKILNAKSNLFTIAWSRNWFEKWSNQPWISDYNLHLTSSRITVEFLSKKLKIPVRLLRIATNPERFFIKETQNLPSIDFVFTGNYWQSQRDVVNALSKVPKRFRGAIYGKNWEQIPALDHLNRGFIPYQNIHEVYQKALIVIDDANHVTKEWAAANSRVFDALASGCLVITNSQSVSEEVFDGLLPVYETPTDLEQLLDHYLTNHKDRDHLITQLRKVVLERHCYRHRAIELGAYLRSLWKSDLGSIEKVITNNNHRTFSHNVANQSIPSIGNAPFISFIVPIYNNLAATQAMLSSLQASLPDGLLYEIILSDDASTDGVRTWLASLNHPHIRVLLNDINHGYARNNNLAVTMASGQVLGLINSDLVFKPGWLEPMLAALNSATLNAGLVGNIQYRISDGSLDHAGIDLSPNAQLHHLSTAPQNEPEYIKAFAVTGACMLIRKVDFDAVGGFEEAFINGCEDIDLCFKMRAYGKEIYLATKSHIGHHVSLSRLRNSLQDMKNSQQLFSRWRKELKRELSKKWYQILQSSPTNYDSYGVGMLEEGFRLSPQIASMVLAESMLKREERAWSDKLKPATSKVSALIKYGWNGLRWSNEHNSYILDDVLEVFIDGQSSILNFYICGRQLHKGILGARMIFNLNNIQRFEIRLDEGQHVNAGITNPIILEGVQNVFKVRSNSKILVSHLVIDEERINLDTK